MTKTKTKNISIAHILNKHIDEIFSLINDNNISGARKLVIELINNNEITDKQAVITANNIFKTAKDNLFLSSLMSYITCMKVS